MRSYLNATIYKCVVGETFKYILLKYYTGYRIKTNQGLPYDKNN